METVNLKAMTLDVLYTRINNLQEKIRLINSSHSSVGYDTVIMQCRQYIMEAEMEISERQLEKYPEESGTVAIIGEEIKKEIEEPKDEPKQGARRWERKN